MPANEGSRQGHGQERASCHAVESAIFLRLSRAAGTEDEATSSGAIERLKSVLGVRRPATHPSAPRVSARVSGAPHSRISAAACDALQQSNAGVSGAATNVNIEKESTRVSDVGLVWRRPDGENTQSVTRVRTIWGRHVSSKTKQRARKAPFQ